MRRNDRAESNTEFSPMSHVFTLYLYPDEKCYRWCLILDAMVGFAEEFEEHGPDPSPQGARGTLGLSCEAGRL